MINSTKLKRDDEEDKMNGDGRSDVEDKKRWLLGSCWINELGERLLHAQDQDWC